MPLFSKLAQVGSISQSNVSLANDAARNRPRGGWKSPPIRLHQPAALRLLHLARLRVESARSSAAGQRNTISTLGPPVAIRRQGASACRRYQHHTRRRRGARHLLPYFRCSGRSWPTGWLRCRNVVHKKGIRDLGPRARSLPESVFDIRAGEALTLRRRMAALQGKIFSWLILSGTTSSSPIALLSRHSAAPVRCSAGRLMSVPPG